MAKADPFGEDELDFPVMKFMSSMRSGVAPIIGETTWFPDYSPSDTTSVKKIVMSIYSGQAQ